MTFSPCTDGDRRNRNSCDDGCAVDVEIEETEISLTQLCAPQGKDVLPGLGSLPVEESELCTPFETRSPEDRTDRKRRNDGGEDIFDDSVGSLATRDEADDSRGSGTKGDHSVDCGHGKDLNGKSGRKNTNWQEPHPRRK